MKICRLSGAASGLLAICVFFLSVAGTAVAQVVINSDMNGNHSPEINTTPVRNPALGGELWEAVLNPGVGVAIGPGASPAELARLAAAYPPPAGGNAGWVIVNGGLLPGIIWVDYYDAFEALPESPPDGDPLPCVLTAAGNKDCVTIEYDNVVGGVQVNPVAPNTLRWIQFICTNAPLGGAPVCIPPAMNGYIDPQPNDDALPFYYTAGEDAIFGLPAGAGLPPMTLFDKSSRGFPLNRVRVLWEARTYLVEWNGITPVLGAPGPNGVLTIHGGVRWGWELGCIAINQPPGTHTWGGGDGDKPYTEDIGEYYAIEPEGEPPPECRGDTTRVEQKSWGTIKKFFR
ncbi:MAG: hypothetical protein ABIH26_11285 [Candidatus Eisenbacteria bacterium]